MDEDAVTVVECDFGAELGVRRYGLDEWERAFVEDRFAMAHEGGHCVLLGGWSIDMRKVLAWRLAPQPSSHLGA